MGHRVLLPPQRRHEPWPLPQLLWPLTQPQQPHLVYEQLFNLVRPKLQTMRKRFFSHLTTSFSKKPIRILVSDLHSYLLQENTEEKKLNNKILIKNHRMKKTYTREVNDS